VKAHCFSCGSSQNPNNRNTSYELLTPKTKKAIRIIIIDGLSALFKLHKREQIKLKMKQRLVYDNQDFILVENTGHTRVMKQVVLHLQSLMKLWM